MAAPSRPPSKASAIASTITETTTGTLPKPRARKVAISTVRVATAEYIVFSAANKAPMAMMTAMAKPKPSIWPARPPDCAARYSSSPTSFRSSLGSSSMRCASSGIRAGESTCTRREVTLSPRRNADCATGRSIHSSDSKAEPPASKMPTTVNSAWRTVIELPTSMPANSTWAPRPAMTSSRPVENVRPSTTSMPRRMSNAASVTPRTIRFASRPVERFGTSATV